MTSQLGPLVVGTLAILGLAGYVTFEDPAPGTMGRAHGALVELSRLAGCEQCHAEQGLTAGCLGCHEEIRQQREARTGFHGRSVGACEECHLEHHGEDFDVRWHGADPEAFNHTHVRFGLIGKHDELTCDQCHRREGMDPFALPDYPGRVRETTYLGTTQECLDCHGDYHEGESYTGCASCHDQDGFKPAPLFDHAVYYPLDGGHTDVACNGCHVAFELTRGTTCAECHVSPHQADWGRSCEECHPRAEPAWTAATVSIGDHARTVFPLDPPHDKVTCESCHAPGPSFVVRYPGRDPKVCRACHTDTHDGQFQDRACLDCHATTAFDPPAYDRARHDAVYPLRFAHAEVHCRACHEADPTTNVREFVGTSRQCLACHEDIHQGQFVPEDCDACHEERRFMPARYSLQRHEEHYPLTGAHTGVSCRGCHEEEQGVRRFTGTPQLCRSCHENPHGKQFAKEQRKGDCTACHVPDARTFDIRPFDHERRTGYALEGAHSEATCAACHRRDRNNVRQYRETPTRCVSCHNDTHRGQFRKDGTTDCARCHASFKEWRALEFDHNRQSRFKLDRTHAQVACDRCHHAVAQPDGTAVVQYRPLGMKCADCHDFESK